MKRQRNLSQMKEHHKITTGDLRKTEISSMSDKKFKVIIVKILTGLGKRIENMSDILNKEIKKNQSEMNTINEIKNTLDGINSRL